MAALSTTTAYPLKWGKQEYSVPVPAGADAAALKAAVHALTGVAPPNQKLMSKKGGWKGPLKDTTKKLKLKPGKTTFVLMGTAADAAAATASASAAAVVFVEDMTTTERAKATQATSPGLNNLGNTCYMNSTLQCLRMIPELRTALRLGGASLAGGPEAQFSNELNKLLFGYMDRVFAPDAVTPREFVTMLRQLYPMFAQQGPRGGFQQQDADELYATVMRSLSASLGRAGLEAAGADADKIAEVFGDRPGLPPAASVTEALFGIGFEQVEECAETDKEARVVRNESEFKLRCNIIGGGGSELKVDHLFQGLELGLSGVIEKRSDVLGRNAQWKRTSRISRLPRYLCVQYMRFYWKKRTPTAMDPSTGTNCKMKRRVQFQDTIDMFKFCSPGLQEVLKVPRDAAVDLQEHAKGGESKDDATAKDDGAAAPMEVDTDGAAAAAAAAAAGGEDDLAAALAMSKGGGSAAATQSAGYGLPADFQGHYELFAVVTHIGRSANSGHYMGWVRREKGSEDWLRFNDSDVDDCKTVDIKDLDGGTGDNDMVYLAFYRALK